MWIFFYALMLGLNAGFLVYMVNADSGWWVVPAITGAVSAYGLGAEIADRWYY